MNGEIDEEEKYKARVKVKKGGTYTLGIGLAKGCAIQKTEIVNVPVDNFPPVVTTDVGLTPAGEIQLLGGDINASNYTTPFGPSHGLTWEWKGPNGFTSNEQNPLINTEWVWGAYYLTVTELRNGCTSSASMDISFQAQKDDQVLDGQGQKQNEETKMMAETMRTPSKGNYIWRTATNKLVLVSNQDAAAPATVMIHNLNGQLLGSKNVNLVKGQNNIELQSSNTTQLKIVSFYVGKKLVLTQKVY